MGLVKYQYRSYNSRTSIIGIASAVILSTAACASTSDNSQSASSAQSVQGLNGKTITIGFSTPESGNIAVYGSMAKAATCYLNSRNDAGGVEGYKFNPVSVDNQGTVSGGANAMNQLLAKGPFLIQVSTTPAFNGSAQVLKAKQSTMVVFGMASGAAIKAAALPNVFGLYTDYTEESFFLYDYILNKLKLKKIALLHDNGTAESGQKAAKYIGDIGGELVANLSIPPTATNMTPYVAKIRDSGAEAVVTMLSVTLASSFLLAAHSQGLNVPIIGYSGSADKSLLDVAGGSAEGYYASDPFPPLSSADKTMAEFKKVVGKCDPNSVTSLGAIGWNEGEVIAAALKQATKNGTKLTQENFRSALYDLSGQRVGFTTVTIDRKEHSTLIGKGGLTMYVVKNGEFVPAN